MSIWALLHNDRSNGFRVIGLNTWYSTCVEFVSFLFISTFTIINGSSISNFFCKIFSHYK